MSSVYVTTESHEKRMRVAGQCALRFAGKIHVVSYFCFKILGNLNIGGLFPRFILGKEGKSQSFGDLRHLPVFSYRLSDFQPKMSTEDTSTRHRRQFS